MERIDSIVVVIVIAVSALVIAVVVVHGSAIVSVSLKLNPLRAKWPMGPALNAGFCSVKQMRVFYSSWMGH